VPGLTVTAPTLGQAWRHDVGAPPTIADPVEPYPDRGVQQQVDSDGDGLWNTDGLADYGTDPMSSDSDSDGVDDYSDGLAGNDPLNPASRPAPSS
jgi:hypothetical protein